MFTTKFTSFIRQEFQSTMIQERQTMEGQIKNLKKERVSMLNAFRKQLTEIETIKKQNSSMMDLNLIEIAEQEYMNLLKWASNDG